MESPGVPGKAAMQCPCSRVVLQQTKVEVGGDTSLTRSFHEGPPGKQVLCRSTCRKGIVYRDLDVSGGKLKGRTGYAAMGKRIEAGPGGGVAAKDQAPTLIGV